MSELPRPPRLVARADLALGMAAVALGSVSLGFPYGRDQGLFHYVAREWIGGAVPYRDTFEQKTPFIYMLHAAAITFFGEGQWGIRVVELVWVLAVGAVIGALATGRGRQPLPGIRGLGALTLVLAYLGLFSYWDTAQTEIWSAGFAFLALGTRERVAHRSWRSAGAGACMALALLAKPAVAPFLMGVLLVAGADAWTERAQGARVRTLAGDALGTLAGAAAVTAPVAWYFAAKGAWPSFVDVVVRANRHYVVQEAAVHTAAQGVRRVASFAREFHPFSTAAVMTLVVGLWRASRSGASRGTRRYGVATLLLFSAYAAVWMQRKFYDYHWGVAAPVFALVFTYGIDDLVRSAPSWIVRPPSAGRLVLAGGAAVFLLFSSTSPGAGRYARVALHTTRYAAGGLSRDAFLKDLALTDHEYDPRVDERVGAWLAAHARPGDEVAVRGFEPVIYVVSGMRAPTRFFWTSWLTDPRRAYRREAFLVEDREALQRRPPRFAVVLNVLAEGPDSASYFPGYVERHREHTLSILERVPPEHPPAP